MALTTSIVRLDMRLPAQWARIDSVREAVALCVAAVFEDPEMQEALAMVSAELLENAVKYGKCDQAGIGFSLAQDGERLCISVTNAIDDSTDLQALQSRIAWIAKFDDPSEAYTTALREVYATEKLEADASGLGLVRVVYEGGCRLLCDDSEPGRLTVRAYHPLPKPYLSDSKQGMATP